MRESARSLSSISFSRFKSLAICGGMWGFFYYSGFCGILPLQSELSIDDGVSSSDIYYGSMMAGCNSRVDVPGSSYVKSETRVKIRGGIVHPF